MTTFSVRFLGCKVSHTDAQDVRERLQLLFGELARVREDGEAVAGERRVGEDVGDDVAKARHPGSLSGRSWPSRASRDDPLASRSLRVKAILAR
jgi:hypothetical protein